MSDKNKVLCRFNVSSVKVNKDIKPVISNDSLLKSWSRFGEVRSFSKVETDVRPVEAFDSPNLFAASVYTAFFKHYPLKINPNVVWLTILQGFSHYVQDNHEELRSKFVSFEGKKTLKVFRPEFRYKNPNNDWENVFPDFANQIEKFIGSSTKELVECNFSNSTKTDQVVSHIALMDICKNYFHYMVCCGCGIPYIELMGTVDDWRLIRQKAGALETFCIEKDPHLKKWLDALLPALDHFVLAAENKPDICFWNSICNKSGASGMGCYPRATGWISIFFPYLANDIKHIGIEWKNAYEFEKKKKEGKIIEEQKKKKRFHDEDAVFGGVDLDHLPTGLSKAPVTVIWKDVGITEELAFYSGLTTMYQHEDGALEVRTGWAVINPDPNSTANQSKCLPRNRYGW
jgi:hypothetical protein